jgi:hypothetical protein
LSSLEGNGIRLIAQRQHRIGRVDARVRLTGKEERLPIDVRIGRRPLAMTELRCDAPNSGLTAPMPREDAYLVGLPLRACL